MNVPAGSLSGGQQQLAREIDAVIIGLNKQLGLTVVLVEQNVSFARQAAHRFAMMEKGRDCRGGRDCRTGR